MLAKSWQIHLQQEFKKDYMLSLKKFLVSEKAKHKIIYPHSKNWFRAFELTPFDKVKVVIIAQDPYHGPNQANGLCFSVNKGIALPPSLQNIFKEQNSDLSITQSENGNLDNWAKNGVLLLNSVLTVERFKAGSHANKGWEIFTNKVIKKLNKLKNNIVFLLWGSYAQNKGEIIDINKHLILKTAHPSPLSAHRGFLGCRHFSKTNDYLKSHNITPIDWQL